MKTFTNWLLNHLNELIILTVAFLAPNKGLFIAVGVLIIIDFFTGIYAAIKQKEAITSKKMGNSINKIIFYNVAIITAALLESVIGDFIPIIKCVAGFLAIRESYSILENVNLITGANLLPYLKRIISKKLEAFDESDIYNRVEDKDAKNDK